MNDKLMEVTCRNVLFYLKHGNLSSFLNHLRHGLHLLPLLGGVLVVVRVS